MSARHPPARGGLAAPWPRPGPREAGGPGPALPARRLRWDRGPRGGAGQRGRPGWGGYPRRPGSPPRPVPQRPAAPCSFEANETIHPGETRPPASPVPIAAVPLRRGSSPGAGVCSGDGTATGVRAQLLGRTGMPVAWQTCAQLAGVNGQKND